MKELADIHVTVAGLGLMGGSLAGAQPLVLEPERQDYIAGTISHLPYLLACALVTTADAMTSADPAVWEIAASGFRDTSRVAGSDAMMMTDILLTNRDLILTAVDIYQRHLRNLACLIESGKERRCAPC